METALIAEVGKYGLGGLGLIALIYMIYRIAIYAIDKFDTRLAQYAQVVAKNSEVAEKASENITKQTEFMDVLILTQRRLGSDITTQIQKITSEVKGVGEDVDKHDEWAKKEAEKQFLLMTGIKQGTDTTGQDVKQILLTLEPIAADTKQARDSLEKLMQTQNIVDENIKPMTDMLRALQDSLTGFPESIRKEIVELIPDFLGQVEQRIDASITKAVDDYRKAREVTNGNV